MLAPHLQLQLTTIQLLDAQNRDLPLPLKIGTAGMSTLLTAGAQGAIAYYSSYVVGKVAERYLVQGKSWGEGGPKYVVREILDGLDRDSILAIAREDIRTHLRG